MKESLARELVDRLDDYGLRFAEPVDIAHLDEGETVDVTVQHQRGRARFHLGYTSSMTSLSFNRIELYYSDTSPILLVGPRVTERSAERFRALGINYLDAGGNAFIAFDGVHIDVRGRLRGLSVDDEVGRSKSRTTVNLFSVKRSQVIFAILSWDELLEAPLRQLATAAGVSLGQVQETLELLTEYGFLDSRRRFVPQGREALIDQWTAAYPLGLGMGRADALFVGEFQDLSSSENRVYISGEAAVPHLLRAETLLLYSEEVPVDLIRARRWRRAQDNATVVLRRKFWADPRGLQGEPDDEPDVLTAPWLLVYADLMASGDGRQREAAQQLRMAQ